uniref:Ig-like domain-containing protein n=1 Tax=Spermophilus dauricus TaxID=99837 RepID=A0A8C9QLS4_SPEDA
TTTKPSVFPLRPCCSEPTSMSLGCLVTGYFPEPVTVTWDTGSLNVSTLDFPTAKLSSGLLARTSQLTVSDPGEWARKSFTCSVGHAPSSTSQVNKTVQGHHPRLQLPGPCPEVHRCGPLLTYLIPPSPLDLYVRTAPKLTCLVVDLESKEGVTVVWTRDSQKPVTSDPWKANKQLNATFSIVSTLPVDAKDWIDGETYRCTVTHPELPKPIIRSITKAPGKRMPPEVYVFLPPEEQGGQDKLTLTCLIQNFFPGDISVQWLRNGQIHNDQHSTTAPLKTNTSHPSFFIFSRLEITLADWALNTKFTCRVVHEALPGRRTLEKTVFKSPELDLQDLCTEELESAELDGLWTSTCVFISLFLLSVSYGATITLFKVKRVFSTELRSTPQALHDYANILHPGA